ncbi:MAG: EAL domain-containing protein, partial [Tissierellia bacterium]|nr:EAL domain-containing protein [Tissierellia bacterium]
NTRELKKMVDEILVDLNSSFIIDDEEFQITTSIGVAIYPDDGIDSTSLIRKAEVAMNKAKESSANRPIIFNNALDTEVQEYFWMKNDLARALSNDELFLNYQPIYDTSIDKLIGVEALIRWRHKEKGIILPTEFIPLAERSGMIHPIGDWVLFNACKQNKKWQDRGYEPVYISVNVSVLQLEQPGFCRVVEEMLKETGLEPEYLQLEITETYFIQKYDSIKDTINELSQLGVRLAIDDFGTGYSSLSQLCTFDVNNIKIDKTFIDGIERDLNKSKIVKALISLAESLNISLTAEGVETQEQLIFLKKNKCTVAQGFLFSEPVDPDGIERMLAKYKGI